MTVSAGPVPDSVAEYFRQKNLKPAFSYLDVWREEHAYEFTVAKVTEADVLAEIQRSLVKAAEEGLDLRAWSKDLRTRLEPVGWWGKREVIDKSTGEIAETELGHPYRLRTIYDTNMRTAFAAQQWQRIQRNKDTEPYLLYLLGPSRVHRVQHVQWAGYLLAADDPWWHVHFPPNGYGCKCHVRTVSQGEYEQILRDGIPGTNVRAELDEDGLPTGHLITDTMQPITTPRPDTYRNWRNTNTGVRERVPKGIDPGFDTNVGATFRLMQAFDLLKQKLPALPEPLALALIQSWVQGPALSLWMEKPLGAAPIAMMPEAIAAELQAQNRIVWLSRETMEKQRTAHPELTDAEYQLLPAMFSEGLVIQQTDQRVAFYRREGRLYKAVAKATTDGNEIYAVTFYRADEREIQRDRARGTVLQEWRE